MGERTKHRYYRTVFSSSPATLTPASRKRCSLEAKWPPGSTGLLIFDSLQITRLILRLLQFTAARSHSQTLIYPKVEIRCQSLRDQIWHVYKADIMLMTFTILNLNVCINHTQYFLSYTKSPFHAMTFMFLTKQMKLTL